MYVLYSCMLHSARPMLSWLLRVITGHNKRALSEEDGLTDLQKSSSARCVGTVHSAFHAVNSTSVPKKARTSEIAKKYTPSLPIEGISSVREEPFACAARSNDLVEGQRLSLESLTAASLQERLQQADQAAKAVQRQVRKAYKLFFPRT